MLCLGVGSNFFRNVTVDRQLHGGSERSHRGNVYSQDGQPAPHNFEDGRHQTPEDDRSWHLLMLGQVTQSRRASGIGHENTAHVDQLRARSCPLATDPLAESVSKAVESGWRAWRDDLRYAEVGGWAAALRARAGRTHRRAGGTAWQESRHARVLSTATPAWVVTILRRLGGSLVVDSADSGVS